MWACQLRKLRVISAKIGPILMLPVPFHEWSTAFLCLICCFRMRHYSSVYASCGSAAIDAWLATQGRKPKLFNAVERLCHIGTRGMGALEFRPIIPARHLPTFRGAEDHALWMVGGSNVPNAYFAASTDDCGAPGMVPMEGWMALRAIELACGSVRTRLLMVGGSNVPNGNFAASTDDCGAPGMVPMEGFEPPTHALRMRCSTN